MRKNRRAASRIKQSERTSSFDFGDCVVQKPGLSQQADEVSRESFNVVFDRRARLDLLCDKLRDALREIAVFGSEEGKLGD